MTSPTEDELSEWLALAEKANLDAQGLKEAIGSGSQLLRSAHTAFPRLIAEVRDQAETIEQCRNQIALQMKKVERLRSERDGIKSNLATLQDCNIELAREVVRLSAERDALKAENERLKINTRELIARGMWKVALDFSGSSHEEACCVSGDDWHQYGEDSDKIMADMFDEAALANNLSLPSAQVKEPGETLHNPGMWKGGE